MKSTSFRVQRDSNAGPGTPAPRLPSNRVYPTLSVRQMAHSFLRADISRLPFYTWRWHGPWRPRCWHHLAPVLLPSSGLQRLGSSRVKSKDLVCQQSLHHSIVQRSARHTLCIRLGLFSGIVHTLAMPQALSKSGQEGLLIKTVSAHMGTLTRKPKHAHMTMTACEHAPDICIPLVRSCRTPMLYRVSALLGSIL